MFETYLNYAYALAHDHPFQDGLLVVPEQGWCVIPFVANIIDEAWFGCEVVYPEGQAATIRLCFSGKKQNRSH